MVKDPEISRHNLVLQDGARGDVNPVPVVGDDDHCATQANWGDVL